ncbi:MAG: pullulanase X25 domain-containing protein, partial [Brachybacterium sp.]
MSVPRSAHPTRIATRSRLLAAVTSLLMATATILGTAPLVFALGPDQPVLAGSLQDELGCEADWDPTCEGSALAPTAV